MKILQSAENYLETILLLKNKFGEIRAVDIASQMNFSKPSVSNALKLLRENGYVSINKKGFISMTETGMKVATMIYERHHLLSEIFISLGVSPSTAESDACKIEHLISEESFEKIKQFYDSKKLKIN